MGAAIDIEPGAEAALALYAASRDTAGVLLDRLLRRGEVVRSRGPRRGLPAVVFYETKQGLVVCAIGARTIGALVVPFDRPTIKLRRLAGLEVDSRGAVTRLEAWFDETTNTVDAYNCSVIRVTDVTGLTP